MRNSLKTVAIDRRTFYAATLLVVCGTLWGATPMLSKLAGGLDAHPVGLSVLVNAMGAVSCIALCWWRGILRLPTRSELYFFFCWAFLYAVLNQVLIYWLSARLDAALVSVFTVLEGLVIFAAAAILRIEKPSVTRCCGLLVGLLGVLFLLFSFGRSETAIPSLFILVGLVIPVSYAAESLYIAARRPVSVHPLLAVALVMGCSLPYLLVLAALSDDFMPLQFPPGRVELLAFAIMVTTLIANLAFFVLISIAGSVFAGQISYFNAIAGIGWGVVVLGEKMPWSMLLSVAFIMMGLLLVRPKPSNEDVPAVRGAQPWPAE